MPRTAFLILCASLLSFAMTGCGGGGSNGGGVGASTSTPAAPLSVSAVTPSGLTATLAEDKSAIAAGGSVTYTVTLTNNTGQPITFQTVLSGNTDSRNTPLSAAITVSNATGVVLRPDTATGGTPIPGPSTTLAPGQSVAATLVTSGFGAVYTQAGTYSATAVVEIYVGPASLSAVASLQSTTVGPLALTVQ